MQNYLLKHPIKYVVGGGGGGQILVALLVLLVFLSELFHRGITHTLLIKKNPEAGK